MIPVCLLAAGIIYHYADPSVSVLMPKCPIRLLTGLQCPSCGIQRALHEWLHGNVVRGVQYNYFLVLALPYAAAIVVSMWYNFSHRFDRLRKFLFSRAVLLTYVYLFCIWFVLRNVLGI